MDSDGTRHRHADVGQPELLLDHLARLLELELELGGGEEDDLIGMGVGVRANVITIAQIYRNEAWSRPSGFVWPCVALLPMSM